MCGIAGALDLTGTRLFPPDRLRAMTRAIGHRGPDDDYAHFEPGLALGCRRLAIVDPAGGRQPLSNEDGSVWVAFNGELFDYPEIRGDLLARGHRLATRCDTEAWVHLYEDHGCEIFARARGQFAVALWSRPRRTLILGRDRVGICPLYYAERDGWLLWGSEIKALLASGMVDPRPDPRAVDYLFSFLCHPTERTFFEGIASLPPGHYLVVEDGRISQHQYWDLDFPDDGEERRAENPATLADELEWLLRRAVERRLRGDVPVVSYLSGGLDSTVVLGLACRESGEPVSSFTIGLDAVGPDERAHSAESAALFRSPLTTLTVGGRAISDAFPELIVAAEGPLADATGGALMRLAGMVHSRGYKVALTGEGADEALGGYLWHRLAGFRSRVRPRVRPWLPNPGRSVAPDVQLDLLPVLGRARVLLYSGKMRESLGDQWADWDLRMPGDRIGRWHPLNRSLYLSYKGVLPGLLLSARGDRAAMSASVETRYPFLDEDVITFCAGLAPRYKARLLAGKWLLRRLAARTLPPRIAKRPKTMFVTTSTRLFLGPDRPPWVDQLLSADSLRATGFFNPEAVACEREAQIHRRRFNPRQRTGRLALIAVLSTQLWHHLYCGGGLCDLTAWHDTRRRRPVV